MTKTPPKQLFKISAFHKELTKEEKEEITKQQDNLLVSVSTTAELFNQQLSKLQELGLDFGLAKKKTNLFMNFLDDTFSKNITPFYQIEPIITLNILQSKEFVYSEAAKATYKSIVDLRDDDLIKLQKCIQYYQNNKESFDYVELDTFGEKPYYQPDQTRILLYAFRYALTRNTHAVLDVVTVITKDWDLLNQKTKETIKKEIREATNLTEIAKTNWDNILKLP